MLRLRLHGVRLSAERREFLPVRIGKSPKIVVLGRCGLSGGKHATLGFFERFDVAAVAAELRARFRLGGVGEPPLAVMGRGAGAVAALLFADARDHEAPLRDAQGRKRVIQRRFNVGVLDAMSEKKASTL